jgi:hypothetical protein
MLKLVTFEYLVGEVEVVVGTGACGVVHDNGLAIARGLGQFSVAIDKGVENQTFEVGTHILYHLAGQAEAGIVHGDEQALDGQFGIQTGLDDADSVEEFAQSF